MTKLQIPSDPRQLFATALLVLLGAIGQLLAQPTPKAAPELPPEIIARFEQFGAKYGRFTIAEFGRHEARNFLGESGFTNFQFAEELPGLAKKGRLTQIHRARKSDRFWSAAARSDKTFDELLPGFANLAIPESSKPFEFPKFDRPFGLYLGSFQIEDQSGFTDEMYGSFNRLDRLKQFDQLRLLDLSGWDTLRTETIQQLTLLKNLHHLSLNGTDIADFDLKSLSQLTQLRTLELGASKRSSSTDAPRKRIDGPDLNYKFTGVGLKELANLSSLRRLSLAGQRELNDAGLKALGELHQIEVLNLAGAGFSDAGLEEVFKLKKLRHLDLSGRLGTQGLLAVGHQKRVNLAGIQGLMRLTSLDIRDVDIGEDGLKEVAKVVQLENLSLSSTDGVSDETIGELAALPRLARLDVSGAIGDAGLKSIAAIKSLQALNLSECQVTAAGIKELAKLEHLHELNLDSTATDDAGLKALAGFPHLELLSISKCDHVTDAGLKELSLARKLKYLRIDECESLTDAGLKSLAGVGSLVRLSALECSNFTEVGVKQLAALPRLETLELQLFLAITGVFKDSKGFKALKSLYLVGQPLSDGEELAKSLPDCLVMVYFFDPPIDIKQQTEPKTSRDWREILFATGYTILFLTLVAAVLLIVFWRRKKTARVDD
jgi:Leucine-rich repeat (LRR) protein